LKTHLNRYSNYVWEVLDEVRRTQAANIDAAAQSLLRQWPREGLNPHPLAPATPIMVAERSGLTGAGGLAAVNRHFRNPAFTGNGAGK